uniref:Uncharacterized protein n=1 Tax=Hippocampus comes TaxID=109280 RepID=A0A3Q2YSX7_HIPCM
MKCKCIFKNATTKPQNTEECIPTLRSSFDRGSFHERVKWMYSLCRQTVPNMAVSEGDAVRPVLETVLALSLPVQADKD